MAGIRKGVFHQRLRFVIDKSLLRHVRPAVVGVEADGVSDRRIGKGRVVDGVLRHARQVDAGGLLRGFGPAGEGALVALARPLRRLAGIDGRGVIRVALDREHGFAVEAAPGHGVILRREAAERGVIGRVARDGGQVLFRLALALPRLRRPAGEVRADAHGRRAAVDRLGAVERLRVGVEDVAARVVVPGDGVMIGLPDGVERDGLAVFRRQIADGGAVCVFHRAVACQRPAGEVVAGFCKGVFRQRLRFVIAEGLLRHRPLAAVGVEDDGVGVGRHGKGREVGGVVRDAGQALCRRARALSARSAPAGKGIVVIALPRALRRGPAVDGDGIIDHAFLLQDRAAVIALPCERAGLRREGAERGVIIPVGRDRRQLADGHARALLRLRRPAAEGGAHPHWLFALVDRVAVFCDLVGLQDALAAEIVPGHGEGLRLPDGIKRHAAADIRQISHDGAVRVNGGARGGGRPAGEREAVAGQRAGGQDAVGVHAGVEAGHAARTAVCVEIDRVFGVRRFGDRPEIGLVVDVQDLAVAVDIGIVRLGAVLAAGEAGLAALDAAHEEDRAVKLRILSAHEARARRAGGGRAVDDIRVADAVHLLGIGDQRAARDGEGAGGEVERRGPAAPFVGSLYRAARDRHAHVLRRVDADRAGVCGGGGRDRAARD